MLLSSDALGRGRSCAAGHIPRLPLSEMCRRMTIVWFHSAQPLTFSYENALDRPKTGVSLELEVLHRLYTTRAIIRYNRYWERWIEVEKKLTTNAAKIQIDQNVGWKAMSP